jgi:glycerol-3-phosphate dehydrogenase (NAD(P)+)
MLAFASKTIFRDISSPVPTRIENAVLEFDGPIFFFFAHTSYYDYALTAGLLRRMGLQLPVMHVAGEVCRGWLSNWLDGFRSLKLPRSFSPIQHRAYSWFTAALAERKEIQVVVARTSRYTVRAREGILREPYVPHGIIASAKAYGRALVLPVAISYAIIPEDRYLTGSGFSYTLPVLPQRPAFFAPYLLRLRPADKLFGAIEGAFGDVSVDVGEPFEVSGEDASTLHRVSHRAVEEIARNKLIHPSHIVAKAMQGVDWTDIKALRDRVEREIEDIRSFFKARYHKEPPLHSMIMTDLPAAVQRGLKDLSARGAVSKSFFHRFYLPGNSPVLQYYGLHADRRIYPLSGRNTMTVINAGVWGYTLALHIGKNLLSKEQLSEHSLILYDSREDLIEKLTVEGRHPWHFKDIPLPRSVRPEADLRAAVSDCSLMLLVTPSKYFYSTVVKLLELAPDGSDLVIAAKGFIPETGLLPCQTVQAEMERTGKRLRLAVLSGANLAHEVVEGGAGVTQIACESFETFERLRDHIETPMFRVVHSSDIVGASVAAALKNVYSIGYGILEGSKAAPENFLAAYSTLVTSEIRQFGLLLGASPETFDAESQVWMADLLATCRGGRSARFGRDLAAKDEKHGKSLPARILFDQYRKKRIAIEGFEASRFAQRMAAQRGFYPPILGEIYSILHSGKKVDIDSFIGKCLDALGRRQPSTVYAVHYRARRG